MKEEEIRKLLRMGLIQEGFSVFVEINRIDVLGIKNGMSHGFEIKSVSGNSFKAIGQALRNSLYVNYSWIVLPRSLIKNDLIESLRGMVVGLIVVNSDMTFSIVKKSVGRQLPAKVLTIPRGKMLKNLKNMIYNKKSLF